MQHRYIKVDENGKFRYCPANDFDGSITGRIIIGLPVWFDENPEERKRLGWIKAIDYSQKEIAEKYPYDKQTQYLVRTEKTVDKYTIEAEYHVMDKSEEMLLLEDMINALGLAGSPYPVFMDAMGGQIG